MDELSMTVFALVVLLAIDFPAVFLYTKAKTAWASDCNLCLHNLKLASFSQAVFFISTSAYFSNHYQIIKKYGKLSLVFMSFISVDFFDYDD